MDFEEIMSKVFVQLDPAYASTCSDVTLYSNSVGFFRVLIANLLSVAKKDDWLEEVLAKKIGETAKIAAVMENKELMNALQEVMSRLQPLYRKKDAKASMEKRIAAQEALAQEDLNKALSLCSQAVIKAPLPEEQEWIDNGVTLALALWLRSEVLMKMKKYELALEDLRLALKYRLSAKIRGQYYWRIGNCYREVGDVSRARVSFDLASQLLCKDETAVTDIAADKAKIPDTIQDPKPGPRKKGISLTCGSKDTMPALSKLVKVTEDKAMGRYVVADSKVKTGDVVLIESPYSACLLPDCYGTHCLHCFKRLEAPVACPQCSGVAFCSIQCRDTAVSTYHPFECPFVDIFIGSGMSILSLIALRMVTQAGAELSAGMYKKYVSLESKTVGTVALNDIEGKVRSHKMRNRKERLIRNRRYRDGEMVPQPEANQVDEPVATNLVTEKNFKEYLENTAVQIYSLCTHFDERKPDDYLSRIVMCFLLKECLKKAAFFKNDGAEDEMMIMSLLLRNLQLLQFNAHEIYETVRGDHKISGSKCNYIAVGVYPTGALFNHDCYPSVARYFDGKSIVLRATRPIGYREVVAENYGPHFLTKTLQERQRSLSSRYWFNCACRACSEDWQLLKNMKGGTAPRLRCANTECDHKYVGDLKNLPEKCPSCLSTVNIDVMLRNAAIVTECVAMYQEGAQLIEEQKISEAISKLTSAVDLFNSVAVPPHKETHLAQEALRTCYASYGNIHQINSVTDKN